MITSLLSHVRRKLHHGILFDRRLLESEINSPFLLNEQGGPRIFFQVLAKNI